MPTCGQYVMGLAGSSASREQVRRMINRKIKQGMEPGLNFIISGHLNKVLNHHG